MHAVVELKVGSWCPEIPSGRSPTSLEVVDTLGWTLSKDCWSLAVDNVFGEDVLIKFGDLAPAEFFSLGASRLGL
jgi:hypothetical protein